MTRYTENLWDDLTREHGGAVTARPGPRWAHRPRVLAGSTLALAGVGTTLAVTLTGGTPAFAVTQTGHDSVLVTLNQAKGIVGANARLTSMGIDEQVSVLLWPGAAPVKGAVTCTSSADAPGPVVKVLVGKDGTEVIPAGNTGAGSWHVRSCYTSKTGEPGNSGQGGPGLRAIPITGPHS